LTTPLSAKENAMTTRTKTAFAAAGITIGALIVALLLILVLRPTGVVPGSASPSASASAAITPSASPGPTVLADDTFIPENIALSSLTWNLPGNCFDSQGRLYFHIDSLINTGDTDCSGTTYRLLDKNARLFDADNWDLEVVMTPVVDGGLPDEHNLRFVGLSSDTNGGFDAIGIGTCGGRWCLSVPRQETADQKLVVIGEAYRTGSSYHLSLRVAPDPAVADHYLLTYRITNLARGSEIEVLKGSLSVEQPAGFQTSARYDQIWVQTQVYDSVKYDKISLSR
jgi:hypothetical protein